MQGLRIEQLSKESFEQFGYYADFSNPKNEYLGKAPVEFYRDILQMYSNSNISSFSVCKVSLRAFKVDSTEYHSKTCEVTMPLDGDILVHLAPATNGEIPFEKMRIFRIPKLTMFVIKPGVWHGAPFTTQDEKVNILVVLPERTYVNDCVCIDIEEQKCPLIEV